MSNSQFMTVISVIFSNILDRKETTNCPISHNLFSWGRFEMQMNSKITFGTG